MLNMSRAPCRALRRSVVCTLHGLECLVFAGRERDIDVVPRRDEATLDHDGHDASLSDERTVGPAPEHGRQETRLKVLDLEARIAQPSDLNDGVRAHTQPRCGAQIQQRDASRGDVLAQLTRQHVMAADCHLREQFGMQEVHLSQIRLTRVFGDSRSVLDRHAKMRVIANTLAGHKFDRCYRRFCERVIPLAMDRHDLTGHGLVRHDVSPDGEPSAEGWVRRLREQGQYSDVACRAGSALS